MMNKNYSTLLTFDSFENRYKYLRLGGNVGDQTFGFERYLNQALYTSKRWRKVRDEIIIRDNACDLGLSSYEIHDQILVHHMNPISVEDIDNNNPSMFDPEFLVCTSLKTHNAIHFGDEKLLPKLPVIRRKNDTCPWR